MNDVVLTLLAQERVDAMLREAQAFNRMTENAPLYFRESAATRLRRTLSREFARLSCALDPDPRPAHEV
jgi:hypothetical protein